MSEQLPSELINRAKELQKDADRYVKRRHPFIMEGSSSAEEMAYFMQVVRAERAKKIAEVGFHLGYSALAFLAASTQTEVTSFDIGKRYVKTAKKLVDKLFPDRHTLIEGDSTLTIPEYAEANPNAQFDLIFVDGGHEPEQALTDLRNFSRLATPFRTAVIIDDLTPWLRWGKGPTQAWQQAKDDGLIQEEERWQDGQRVQEIVPPGQRAWALGYYTVRLLNSNKSF